MRALIILLVLLGSNAIAQDWELRKNENGIMVYTRDATGANRFRSAMVVTRVNAGLSETSSLIMNPERFHEWIYRCESAKTLQRSNGNALIHYQVNSVPFAKDRDMVIKLERIEDELGTITIKQTAVEGFYPEQANFTRIKIFDGLWELTATSEGTEIKYTISTDPGGDLPKRLVNKAIVEGPYQTTLNMKTLLEQNKQITSEKKKPGLKK